MTTFLEIPVFFGLSIEVYIILLCIAFPTFFFWRLIFRKFIVHKVYQKAATWASTLILTPIIYTGLIAVFIYLISREPSSDFDEVKWRTDIESRFEMGDDIVESRMLIGKDTNQVKVILGQATWKDNLNKQWNYNMGMGGGLGFLFHNLSIKFKNNVVTNVYHTRIED